MGTTVGTNGPASSPPRIRSGGIDPCGGGRSGIRDDDRGARGGDRGTPVTFPGGHDGFLGGEFGRTGDPDAFADTLRQILAG